MKDDLKLLGVHVIMSCCLCVKVITSPIVWLSKFVDSKKLIADKK